MRRLSIVLVLLAACGGEEPERAPRGEEGSSASAMSEMSAMSAMSSMQAGPQRPTPEQEAQAAPEPQEHAAPPEGAAPLPPAIGQWVRYGATFREGGRSTTEYRIVDRERGGYWIEVTDVRRRRTRQVRMLVRPADDGAHEVMALAFENQGQVEEVPSRLVGNYAPMLQQWLGMLFPRDLSGEREDVEVAAGTFLGAAKRDHELEFMGQRIEADVWVHAAVPVSGIVRFRARGQGGHELELIGFGLEGAVSRFGR